MRRRSGVASGNPGNGASAFATPAAVLPEDRSRLVPPIAAMITSTTTPMTKPRRPRGSTRRIRVGGPSPARPLTTAGARPPEAGGARRAGRA